MTKDELLAWRNRHFGKWRANAKAANALGISKRTLEAMLGGQREVSKPVEIICRQRDELAQPNKE